LFERRRKRLFSRRSADMLVGTQEFYVLSRGRIVFRVG
jgi:hypothetical protein